MTKDDNLIDKISKFLTTAVQITEIKTLDE